MEHLQNYAEDAKQHNLSKTAHHYSDNVPMHKLLRLQQVYAGCLRNTDCGLSFLFNMNSILNHSA